MNAEDLIGLEVVGSNAWKIGKVKDLVIETKSWQVTAIVVELEKSVAEEFRLKRRLSKTHIPLNVSYVQAVGDRVILKSSKEEVFQQVAAATSENDASKLPQGK
jgi:sporulation protein YlmC with PRC-barrel domain